MWDSIEPMCIQNAVKRIPWTVFYLSSNFTIKSIGAPFSMAMRRAFFPLSSVSLGSTNVPSLSISSSEQSRRTKEECLNKSKHEIISQSTVAFFKRRQRGPAAAGREWGFMLRRCCAWIDRCDFNAICSAVPWFLFLSLNALSGIHIISQEELVLNILTYCLILIDFLLRSRSCLNNTGRTWWRIAQWMMLHWNIFSFISTPSPVE